MAQPAQVHPIVQRFLDDLPEVARPLMAQSGAQLIEELGLDAVRDVVFDVLCGVNIRDSTESLTRKRIALLNAATITQFARMPITSDAIDGFLDAITNSLRVAMSHSDAWMLNWALGLTGKARQNVLRDGESLDTYARRFVETLQQAAETASRQYGELSGAVTIHIDGANHDMPLDWLTLLYMASTLGAQTLTIRGSDKSRYGKLFEKLILGSVLSILGFQFSAHGPTAPTPGQFWLSSTAKRESDATLLIEAGKGVRFDLGFIGRGNSEISLDKVSRFERAAEFNQHMYQMATFIIVDRIGSRSKLEKLASGIDGTVIQMSLSYWPQSLAARLHERFGYDDILAQASPEDAREIIKERLAKAPLEALLRKASDVLVAEESKPDDA